MAAQITFQKDNIVLIGMPASGKSTVGVVLAKMLGYDFIDTDLLIQRQEGCRLDEIIARDGLDGFLEIENAVCAAVKASRTVIATGGSVVYGEEAMRHLGSFGQVVYLEVDLGSLRGRLQDIHQRGVVLRRDQSLEDLYRERIVLYERYADLVVREEGLTLEETAEAVLDGVRQTLYK